MSTYFNIKIKASQVPITNSATNYYPFPGDMCL